MTLFKGNSSRTNHPRMRRTPIDPWTNFLICAQMICTGENSPSNRLSLLASKDECNTRKQISSQFTIQWADMLCFLSFNKPVEIASGLHTSASYYSKVSCSQHKMMLNWPRMGCSSLRHPIDWRLLQMNKQTLSNKAQAITLLRPRHCNAMAR